MRRFCKRGLPVALFVAITLLYPLLAPPAHRIDLAHYEQIRVGMTLEEVESRLGAPAGNYDWAVPKNLSILIRDLSNYLAINEVSSSQTVSSVVLNRASDDAIVRNITYAQPSQKLYSSIVNLTVKHRWGPSRTWTSRHGTCTIQFDENDRVAVKSSWGESRLELPWHNWRKWVSK